RGAGVGEKGAAGRGAAEGDVVVELDEVNRPGHAEEVDAPAGRPGRVPQDKVAVEEHVGAGADGMQAAPRPRQSAVAGKDDADDRQVGALWDERPPPFIPAVLPMMVPWMVADSMFST